MGYPLTRQAPRVRPSFRVTARHEFRLLMALALVLGTAVPAAAQGLVGHLYDFETGVAVSAARVVMTDEAADTVGQATSDSAGRFVIIAEQPGNYSLSVSRLGYVSHVSTDIKLEDDKLRDLEITVHGDAVEIEGLVVSARPRVQALNRLGFYERKESGRGNFVLPTDIEMEQAFSTGGLLRSVPGITVREGIVRSVRRAIQGPDLETRPCALKVLVNGVDSGIDLDKAVRRRMVTGIEVYNSLSAVPPQYLGVASSGFIDTDPAARQRFSVDADSPVRPILTERTCGAVLVWTAFGVN